MILDSGLLFSATLYVSMVFRKLYGRDLYLWVHYIRAISTKCSW